MSETDTAPEVDEPIAEAAPTPDGQTDNPPNQPITWTADASSLAKVIPGSGVYDRSLDDIQFPDTSLLDSVVGFGSLGNKKTARGRARAALLVKMTSGRYILVTEGRRLDGTGGQCWFMGSNLDSITERMGFDTATLLASGGSFASDRPAAQPLPQAVAKLHGKLQSIKDIGAPAYSLPRLVPMKAPPPAPPKTLAWWGQQRRWPPALVTSIGQGQPAGKVYEEPEIMALAHLSHAPKHSIKWWGLHRELPAWLVAAMSHGKPLNIELTEQEMVQLAVETAGLPLGRKGGL